MAHPARRYTCKARNPYARLVVADLCTSGDKTV